MKMLGTCVSDKGIARKVNQDSICYKEMKPKNPSIAIGAVFDGIGGMERGELASQALANELLGWANEILGRIEIKGLTYDVFFALVKNEMDVLNEVVREIIEKEGIKTGSTMSLIAIFDNHYLILNVGDSRIYRLNDLFVLLSDDDIVVKNRGGYLKKYLTNFMGMSDDLSFSEQRGKIKDGDGFLFCSDGFYHHLAYDDLKILRKKDINKKQIEEELIRLIGEMIKRGERDNISVGFIKVQEEKWSLSGLFS